MRVLLDTHVALWLLGDGVHELADDLVERLADPATDVQLSAASVWEIEIKRGLGKLTVDADIVEAGEAGEGSPRCPSATSTPSSPAASPGTTPTPSTACSWLKPSSRTSPW